MLYNEEIANMKVCDIVTKSPGRAGVLTKFGLDFCCGGAKPLNETCEKKGIEIATVVNELLDYDARNEGESIENVENMSATELCDLIVGRHHNFLRNHLQVTGLHAQKVARVHGEANPTLVQIAEIFAGLRNELEPHMMKEERILFPLIKQLEHATEPLEAHCGSVRNPIRAMFMEHHSAGAALAKLRELTTGYQPPNHACNTYRALFAELEMLERDTHAHIHLENHVLFVKAQEIEAKLMGFSTE